MFVITLNSTIQLRGVVCMRKQYLLIAKWPDFSPNFYKHCAIDYNIQIKYLGLNAEWVPMKGSMKTN